MKELFQELKYLNSCHGIAVRDYNMDLLSVDKGLCELVNLRLAPLTKIGKYRG